MEASEIYFKECQVLETSEDWHSFLTESGLPPPKLLEVCNDP